MFTGIIFHWTWGWQKDEYRDLIKRLEAAGWYFHRQGRGDHMIYRHVTRVGSIVVAGGGKLNRDVPTGPETAILRQAGLK